MTTPRLRVALVTAAGADRTALAGYLRNAGFDVHACDEVVGPSSFAALVAIPPHDASSEALLARTRAWIEATRIQRVVVVTSRPTVLKGLLATHAERLRVLPAPSFGWELVDALRAAEPTRRRGA